MLELQAEEPLEPRPLATPARDQPAEHRVVGERVGQRRAEPIRLGRGGGADESLWRSQADERIRTADPFITSEVLYQLSYVGVGDDGIDRAADPVARTNVQSAADPLRPAEYLG